MTDKQMIIDGVDVSGCINYEEYFEEDEDVKIENFCAYWHNSCRSCHNYNCNYKMYKRKEQECEELKDRIVKNKCEEIGKETFVEWKIKKLEKALTEIKEIAENAYCLTNGTNKDMANFANQILQKISECEVAK